MTTLQSSRSRSYSELLKDPRWQRRRLRVLERADFTCERCSDADSTLHAHHKRYVKGMLPWEYEDALLECLCESCHDLAHAEQEQLDLIVGRQPTATIPALTEVVKVAIDNGLDPAMPPRLASVFHKLGLALTGGNSTALVDAQNELQDLIDENVDFLRGPGVAA